MSSIFLLLVLVVVVIAVLAFLKAKSQGGSASRPDERSVIRRMENLPHLPYPNFPMQLTLCHDVCVTYGG